MFFEMMRCNFTAHWFSLGGDPVPIFVDRRGGELQAYKGQGWLVACG